jgi:hypothetical protein
LVLEWSAREISISVFLEVVRTSMFECIVPYAPDLSLPSGAGKYM